jgi:hypothetical protein
LQVIGKAIGVSRFALVKYRNGQRPIPMERRTRLADYLEAHARQVLADADAPEGLVPQLKFTGSFSRRFFLERLSA